MLFSIRKYLLTFFLSACVVSTVLGQAVVTVDERKDACNGLFNGSVRITVTSGIENLSYFMIGINFSQQESGSLDVGIPVTVNNLRPDNYILIIEDGDDNIPNYNTVVIIGSVSGVTASVDPGYPIDNTSCVTPNGEISITASGGSGSYTYFWDGPGSFTATTEDITGISGGTYELTVFDQGTNCVFTVTPIIVDDPSPVIFSIVPPLAKTVCVGDDLIFDLNGSESGVSYEVIRNGNPTGVTEIGDGSPLTFTVPGGTFVTGDIFSITATNGFCTPATMTGIVNVTVAPLPTISGVVVGSVCAGSTSTNLNYTSTTGSPNQYSIDFDGTAEGAGFIDVANVALPASPIVITIPGAAAAGNYNAILRVRNSTTGCIGPDVPITITLLANPTITLGPNPSVCIGSATASLTYSATTGSPNQYSIDFNPGAETAGFVDVANAALPASPISITIPGIAAPGTYNATLTVHSTSSTCSSSSQPITVTINPNPTITLGPNPTVCSGITTVDLGYSATTGSPDEYSIDFNGAAETAGFTDVVNAALPATPIGITVPAVISAGVYNATFSVRNSATGCISTNTNITITVIASPTITLGPDPEVCIGSATANLTYTATSGGANQYSIDFDGAAETAGFVDVSNVVLPASPIVITVPGTAAAGTYNGTLTVLNTITGCVSSSQPISVTINPEPTITLDANPSVCTGSTTASLGYSATTGSPDQYSIDFNGAAEGVGFADVTNVALPASPISITVPGAAAAGAYNATLIVQNSATGCVSASQPISVTIVPSPTITLDTNPSVCVGSTTANLGYTATTASPDEYSINFNGAAETAGFVDVVNAALPASPIVITVPGAAAAGVYSATLTVRNSVTGCISGNQAIAVTIVANPTITLGPNPSVCIGSVTANLGYTATTGSPNQYSIDFDGAAEGAGFADVASVALPASPIVITVPGAAAAGTYNGTLTVLNTITGCVSSSQPISVTINPEPTITPDANPSVCAGSTTTSLGYSATTGSPDQYSINFNGAAEGVGFADVTNVALPASPISITVPGAAAAGTYNATLIVRNSATGCVSASQPISVTIVPSPTITLDTNPSVCVGSTTANLGYTATTASPNEYSINFNGAAETAGFVDVVNAALPASPIVITVPGAAAAGVYNATLTVRNSVTGCISGNQAITVTIVANPTITLGTNPSVCIGSVAANLGYTATTGSPNQYSIDFDGAAEGAGFADVASVALPASPIVITVPGAAASGTYNGTLTVLNTITGCVSSSQPISVAINPEPTITLDANPSVCTGSTTASLGYSATTGSPDQYSINFNGAAEGVGFADVTNVALPASPISITVPGAAAAGTYNATLIVRNSATGCVSASQPISVTIVPSPTITLDTNPSVCVGSTTANLDYTATTASPDEYSINFNGAAETAGFVDVVNAALPASPIVITVPGAAAAGVYNATLTVRNSVTGCISGNQATTVTIVANPTITLGTNPSVCIGSVAANLGYTATTGSPNQYSIDFDGAAEGAGFADVASVALPASPIVITVPGAAASGTYNGTLTVLNTITGCVSSSQPISVAINDTPTITLGANPSVCLGDASADLGYSATSGSPDQYSIDFDAAAESEGFADVNNVPLPASPIAITIPGTAIEGIYNATLTVRNSGSGCISSSQPITVTINPIATISGIVVGSVCAGSPSTNLNYTSTTGTPDLYSIDFDAIAEGEGFVDVVNVALPASPIAIAIPALAGSGNYNAIVTVTNSGSSCSSTGVPITVTILPNPTITLGPNPTACDGSLTADLTYTATTGSPNQYSINFDPAAEAAGFVDVVTAALPASPISITIPGAAGVGIFNATLTVLSTSSTCSSGSQAITVTINEAPTITLGANPTVCSGTTTADLPYSATTGSPDQYIIDFNPAAEAQGFVDVTTTGLPVSPIAITVPAGAVAGVYDATLTVLNSTTGCFSTSQAITVTIIQSPTATISGTTTICDGSTANLTVTFTGTGPWQFQYTDGTTTSPVIPSFFSSINFPVPTVTATYTLVMVSDASVCPGTVNGSATVTVNQNPQTNLTVDVVLDPLCSGGGTDITVDNSEAGVSYQLRNDADDSPVGTPVVGTGGTILLPTGSLLTTTTFNVLATATGCASVELTTLATVNVSGVINPSLAVTALANPICEGNATVIQIANSENGVLYQLRDDATDNLIGSAVAGTGATIDLPTGNLTNTTTFNVLASNGSCSIELTDLETVDVNVNPDPSLAVAVSLDPICVGGSSDITVALSEVGVSYQLRDDADDSNVGVAVVGNGGTISLSTGVLNVTTTFNVLATSGVCPAIELTTLATVNVSGSIDASLPLTAVASPICSGTGTDIQIDNSENGVSYQLRNNADNSPVGTPVVGTGATIDLPTGNLAATTTFNVLANNGSCSIQLTDTETVAVDITPDAGLTVATTLDPLCDGGISAVTVALSQSGVSYQLRNDADDSDVGSPVIGNGGTINLSTGVLNATTTFNVLASSGVCSSVELTQLATITVAGSINAALTLTSSASPICEGTSTFIQIELSEAGVTYQLRNDADDTTIGTAIAGNGGTINLPTGNLAVTTTFNVVADNGTCSIELTETETVDVNPTPDITLAVAPTSGLICSGTSTSIVVTASESGVSYQLRNNSDNSAIGSAVAGNGGNISLPTGNLTTSTTFNVLATIGTCSAQLTSTASVAIRPIGDPACGPGGSDCANFSAIIPTIVTQPSCNDRDAGEVSFTISRSDATPSTFRVIWSYNGTDQTKFTSNTVSFDDLSSGLYQYTIIDEGNGKTCGPVDFFLDLKTQVEIQAKEVLANVTCFEGTNGNVKLTVDGSTTGEYWYKYVLDGQESIAQTFTPGAPLPGGLPADDDDFIIIKVDQSAAFACPDTVMVRIRHTYGQIDFSLASTEVTTCNGTDGAVQVTGITGGNTTTSVLQIRLKKEVPLSTDPSGYLVVADFEDVAAGSKDYADLAQGNYIVDVQDESGCVRSKPIAIQAPGQVPLAIVDIIATDASCANEGASGIIQVTINQPGIYEVAVSQDQVNVPADDQFVAYNSPSLPNVTFSNLIRGRYFLYIKSNTTACPTRTDVITIGGVYAVSDFDVLSNCGNVNLTLNNITGQEDTPFVIRVFNNNDKFFKIDSLTASAIPLSNSVSFNYSAPLTHKFLTEEGTYRFVMIQQQSTGAGTCTLVSDTVVYDVRQQVDILLGNVVPSFPEPKRTGSIEIENIIGGTRFISGANELYYEVSLTTAGDDIVVFDWAPAKLNPQNKFSALFDYLSPGVYRVKVRDASGCIKTQDVEIGLDPTVFVPNIFTPNDDAVNDEFEVLNLPLDGKHKLIISNRWGNEVFSSKDYREGQFWNAAGASDGIYFYRLQVEGGETYTGWVEVLRGNKP